MSNIANVRVKRYPEEIGGTLPCHRLPESYQGQESFPKFSEVVYCSEAILANPSFIK
jgi:hypothetical protein